MDDTRLYQREGSDCWYVRFTPPGGTLKRVSLKTSNKKEAKARAEELVKAAWENKLIKKAENRTGITLKEAFKIAKRTHEKWRDSKSPETIEGNFRYVCEKYPADSDLIEVTFESVLGYTEELREEGMAPSTINQRLSLLSILMRYAEKPTGGAVRPFKMPRQTVRNGRIRVLSRAEEQKVLDWFLSEERTVPRDRDMADLVVFLVDTGFRLSEALRVRSPEVDWDNELVPAWENKADHPRQVPMTDRVMAILEARKDLEYPFGVLTKDYAEGRWATARTGIGIDVERDPEFVLHALRHTCASRLAAAGQDAFRIQKWMGHKNISTTQKYVTLFANDLKGLAKTLNDGYLESAAGIAKDAIGKAQNCATFVSGRSTNPPVVRTVTPREIKGLAPPDRYDMGLLIRRSLVRAQVGEPNKHKHLARIFAGFLLFWSVVR